MFRNSFLIIGLMKRTFDIIFSFIGLLVFLPIIIFICLIIIFKEKSTPIYVAKRVGINGKDFKMLKIRTMIVNAELTGVNSTAQNDPRVTKIGYLLRKYKLDELPQLFNILFGQMSFVGPRPNVRRDTNLYTNREKSLLSIRPGITDFASIVFSDESLILKNSSNPNLSYNQLIRPGKSHLGLFYLKKRNFLLDICLILITIVSIFSRSISLKLVTNLLKKLKASKKLIEIASRKKILEPTIPPGAKEIVSKC